MTSAAPAPTTKRFYKYLTRVYHIIEKNRDWYEDLLENKVSDHQFTVSFSVFFNRFYFCLLENIQLLQFGRQFHDAGGIALVLWFEPRTHIVES